MENTGGIGNYSNSKARLPPTRTKVKAEMGKLIAGEVMAATSMAAQWMRRTSASCCGNSKARFPPKRGKVKAEMAKLIADEVMVATSMAAQWMTRMITSCCGNSAIAPAPSSKKDDSKP